MIKRISFSYPTLLPPHYGFIKNRKNKGITAFYKTSDQRKDIFSALKNPSHFFNDFSYRIFFCRSKGIDVFTVVATATIGNYAYGKTSFLECLSA